MNALNFYDPKTEFDYVGDRVLWNTLFTQPFPKDITNINKGTVVLNNYFGIEVIPVETGRGYKKLRKYVYPTEAFSQTDEYMQNTVFTALCDFLITFKRPYRDCCIMLPIYPDRITGRTFMPITIYEKIPKYPDIDRKQNLIKCELDAVSYNTLSRYMGTTNKATTVGTYTVAYAFQLFYGFVLDH